MTLAELPAIPEETALHTSGGGGTEWFVNPPLSVFSNSVMSLNFFIFYSNQPFNHSCNCFLALKSCVFDVLSETFNSSAISL